MHTSLSAGRVVQFHPSRRCNLRCAHCYSSSSPEERDALDVGLLTGAIADAAAQAYDVASFSGGEPTLYPHLVDLLDCAIAHGMHTSLVTHGMLLNERRLESLRSRVGLLAISLDGVPASHDLIRRHPGAFEAMASGLPRLRASGIPFGFIFTLTRSNLAELPWVAQFAVEQGARLLQIHPLEETGRARTELQSCEPEDEELATAFLAALELRERYAGRIIVHLDVLDCDELQPRLAADAATCPGQVGPITPWESTPLAAVVSPLVVEADGTVMPLQYGFARDFALGNLRDDRLSHLAARWKRDRYDAFHTLCRRTAERLTKPTDLPFANWYKELTAQAGADSAQSFPAGGRQGSGSR